MMIVVSMLSLFSQPFVFNAKYQENDIHHIQEKMMTHMGLTTMMTITQRGDQQ